MMGLGTTHLKIYSDDIPGRDGVVVNFTITWLNVGLHGKSDIKLIVLQHSYQYIRQGISLPDIPVHLLNPATAVQSYLLSRC